MKKTKITGKVKIILLKKNKDNRDSQEYFVEKNKDKLEKKTDKLKKKDKKKIKK